MLMGPAVHGVLCFSGSIRIKHMTCQEGRQCQEAMTTMKALCLAPACCCRSGARPGQHQISQSNTEIAKAWHHACMPRMCYQSKAALQGLLADFTPFKMSKHC